MRYLNDAKKFTWRNNGTYEKVPKNHNKKIEVLENFCLT